MQDERFVSVLVVASGVKTISSREATDVMVIVVKADDVSLRGGN